MRFLLILITFLLTTQAAFAQELRCQVTVTSLNPSMLSDYQQQFRSLQTSIQEFMLQKKWTEDEYEPNERIDCSFAFTIEAFSGSEWKGTMQVTASRPVYGTGISSPILNVVDREVAFTFTEFQRINYVENSYTDELASLLSFYSYVILGLDYDGFGEMSGTRFYEKARDITSAAAVSSSSGWQSYSKNKDNRFFLVQALLDERNHEFRKAWYAYHRLGLDIMTSNPDEGRKVIVENLEKLKTLYRRFPGSVIWQTYFEAKRREYIDVLKQASPALKTQALAALVLLDPSNASLYENGLK